MCPQLAGPYQWLLGGSTNSVQQDLTALPHTVVTPREREIIQLLAEGKSNKEAASILDVSVKTVEANLTRIYRKLGVASRRELARQISAGDT